MKNAAHYHALASLCRQQAAYNPAQSWLLLGQAQRWEHLAADELDSHFKDCNAIPAVSSSGSAENAPGFSFIAEQESPPIATQAPSEQQETPNVHGMGWETIAAA